MPDTALEHLRKLVAFDTRNPPRNIGPDGLFAYLREHLPGFEHTLTNHGDGCVSLLAVRGRPDVLFNVHMDTVPDSEHWRGDPFTLEVTEARACGLGACDIKGAAACLLSAASAVEGDAAFLFSSDEEAGSSRCIREFLATDHGFERVVVAEPTGCRAVIAHRGVLSLALSFSGTPGHASDARALDDSAIHLAAAWIGRALEYARAQGERRYQNLHGMPLNVGTISGGIKNNVIAPGCEVKLGMRPLPGQVADEIEHALRALIEPAGCAQVLRTFTGPALPSEEAFARGEDPLPGAGALAEALELPVGDAVDFWTEAALFSAAGLTALVFGPGDIAQAHTADEWVSLEQLQCAETAYRRIIAGEAGGASALVTGGGQA